MEFIRYSDAQTPVAQAPWECALACTDMALRLRGGVDVERVKKDLRTRLAPAKRRGASFAAIAVRLGRKHGVRAIAGYQQELDEVLEMARTHAVILGVDASVLYELGAPCRHALYVAGFEVPLHRVPKVVSGWMPTMRDITTVTLIDPEPLILGRYEWRLDDVQEAYLGEFLAIPLGKPSM